MPNELDYQRKLELNEWIINARWFYMVAVFLIGILGNALVGLFEIKFSYLPIFVLLLFFIFINGYFQLDITEIKKNRSEKKLMILSILQIAIEMVIFSVIMYTGGDKFMANIFFFLPIISAAMMFGIKGGFIVAILSAVLVNITSVYDYFFYLYFNVLNKNLFNPSEVFDFKFQTVSLIKTITTSNFYLVLGIFSGYTSKLLFKREERLISQSEKLAVVSEYRENELKQLDKTTKLLVKRDSQLTAINHQLDKKIDELEKSERAMMKAFADLKEERKKSEEASNKISAIISNFIDPIMVIDKENKLSLLNPAAKNIFGLIETDIGKEIATDNNYSMNNFRIIIKKEFAVKNAQELKLENQNEEEIKIDYAGQEMTYKVITEKVSDNRKEYLGVMKIFYNLTREKMIDKLKSDFISIAAHQLRTPLSAIKWVMKMILDGDVGKLNDEQTDLLAKGYESNERIIHLVNDMLNVSRIEEGRFGFSFENSDFKKVVDLVIGNLENRIKEQHLKFTLNLPAKMPLIYMDSQKMELVLQNMLENSVKYTPEYGKVDLSVEVSQDFFKIKIKDNGVGIPKKDQHKIFNTKFFRAENVTRMQTEGSGLGLFMVSNIIKKHGGEIVCESEEGKGTEFIITLPLK
jgi:signal transduction histidine kinase